MPISPLIQRYDPYGQLQRQAAMGMLRGREFGDDRDLTIADLMEPEEKQSYVSWLAEQGATGLGTVAYGLDTLGAGVRGLLAGKPGSVFGSSGERVSGRDLLREYNLIGDEDTWGNFAAGIATEILTDPISYVNPLAWLGTGAKTAAAKAAGKSGLLKTARATADELAGLPKFSGKGVRQIMKEATPSDFINQISESVPTFNKAQAQEDFINAFVAQGGTREAGEEALNQVLSKDFGFNVPFTNKLDSAFNVPGVNMAKVGDAVEGYLGTGFPAGMTARAAALFDTDVQGVFDPKNIDQTIAAQKAARIATRNKKFAEEPVSEEFFNLVSQARQAKPSLPEGLRNVEDVKIQRALNDYAEDPQYFMANLQKPEYAAVYQVPEYKNLAEYIRRYGDSAKGRIRASGGNPQQWSTKNWAERQFLDADNKMNFVPRQRAEFVNPDLPEQAFSKTGRYKNTDTVFGTGVRGRKASMDLPQWVMRELASGERGKALKKVLQETKDIDVRSKIDEAFREVASEGYGQEVTEGLYGGVEAGLRKKIDKLQFNAGKKAKALIDKMYDSATTADEYDMLQKQVLQIDKKLKRDIASQEKLIGKELDILYKDMANRLRFADNQFTDPNVGTAFFDSDIIKNMQQSIRSTAQDQANYDAIYNLLGDKSLGMLRAGDAANAIEGGGFRSLKDVANELRLDKASDRFKDLIGDTPLSQMAVDEKAMQALKSLAPRTSIAEPTQGLLKYIDKFTSGWKTGALTFPSYATRNLYSGYLNNLVSGAGDPRDFAAALLQSLGRPGYLVSRLRKVPRYANMNDEEILSRFAADVASQGVVSGNVVTDAAQRPSNRLFPGRTVKPAPMVAKSEPTFGQRFGQNISNILTTPKRLFTDPQSFAIVKGMNRINEAVEDALRVGTFSNQMRKGSTVGAAGDMTRKLNVDYTPEAFTEFEQNVLKRIFPFYSFQRGIIPSIRDNLLERPGGTLGQTVRVVNRSTEPGDDSFTPERLRRQVSLPLPEGASDLMQAIGFGSDGNEVRLSNIDLPFSSLFNLITPGTSLADTATNTLGNIAGDMHPALKYLIESATGRQLYSGARLKDLYSTLENLPGFDQLPGGYARGTENIIRNLLPYGSRGMSLAGQLLDDRNTGLANIAKTGLSTLTGSRMSQYDPLMSKEQFVRQKVQDVLRDASGTKTFENIYVKDEDLANMSKREQDLYLLYRTIQSEAQARARANRKEEEAKELLKFIPAQYLPQ